MKKNIFLLLLCTLGAASAQAQQGNTQTLVQYLSGRGFDDTVKWEFFCTTGQNSGRWTTINVPSCWEQQGFGGYTYGVYFYGKPTAPGHLRRAGAVPAPLRRACGVARGARAHCV